MAKLGVKNIEDLLHHFPRRYIDRSLIAPISKLPRGEEVTTVGRVRRAAVRRPRRSVQILEVDLEDESGTLRCVWFNQAFRARHFSEGSLVAVSGKVEEFRGRIQISNPAYDVVSEGDLGPGSESGRDEPVASGRIGEVGRLRSGILGPEPMLEIGRIVPVYPASAEVTGGRLRRCVWEALQRAGDFADPLSAGAARELNVIDRTRAIREIHFPSSPASKERARRRLVVDELLRLQLALAIRRRQFEASSRGISHPRDAPLTDRLVASLPFELTEAQQRAINEIRADMASPVPMHRLLQGEVGSGKTIVAAAALTGAISGGRQGVLMAPTEVLAGQHYFGLSRLLEPLGVRMALMTGSKSAAERKRDREDLAAGKIDLAVGTQALIQEGVAFADLGLAVVDEQHRFGIRQRMRLREGSKSGYEPDLLIMTATPIPRTLAVTLYGDLDISLLDQLPPGRRPVKTSLLVGEEREAVYGRIRSEVESGNAAFVICPLVEESEKLEVKAAEAEFKRLRDGPLAGISLGLIHGKMSSEEKAAAMDSLAAGETDVLVATTVIEVGVDIPRAAVIVIEDADRFGLAQLHQLRGRVGRGDTGGSCYLLTESEDRAALDRLRAMVRLSDGFALAEEDLRLRGEGSLFGIRQSGKSDLRLTRLLEDTQLIIEVRDFARRLVERDPRLESAPVLASEVSAVYDEAAEWLAGD